LADLDPTRGHEKASQPPVLILSHEIFNQRPGVVIAMALTSQPQRAGFPPALELADANFPKKSRVKISRVRTLSVQRLSRKIGRAKPEQVDRAITGLNQIVAP
jgi:mRNA interferase MazF